MMSFSDILFIPHIKMMHGFMVNFMNLQKCQNAYFLEMKSHLKFTDHFESHQIIWYSFMMKQYMDFHSCQNADLAENWQILAAGGIL